jgi:hypothetical protein
MGVMILRGFISVRAAIEFHGQPSRDTNEVDDVRPQRMLSAKLQPSELLAAKRTP